MLIGNLIAHSCLARPQQGSLQNGFSWCCPTGCTWVLPSSRWSLPGHGCPWHRWDLQKCKPAARNGRHSGARWASNTHGSRDWTNFCHTNATWHQFSVGLLQERIATVLNFMSDGRLKEVQVSASPHISPELLINCSILALFTRRYIHTYDQGRCAHRVPRTWHPHWRWCSHNWNWVRSPNKGMPQGSSGDWRNCARAALREGRTGSECMLLDNAVWCFVHVDHSCGSSKANVLCCIGSFQCRCLMHLCPDMKAFQQVQLAVIPKILS